MLFPIHIGNKKSHNIYKKLYSRDYHNVHSERDHAPFRESTTSVPYTQCPTYPNDSEEGKRPPLMGSDCNVKVSKVVWK